MTIQVLENNTLVLPNDVEVGDIKQPVFYPQIKIKPWNNECNFSMRLAGSGITWDMVDDKVVWTSEDGKVESSFYWIEGEEKGIYEFDITLKEKPVSNVLAFTLKYKELLFFYQPELTQEEIDEGYERPDNVVGSYAVYHNSKINNEYKTGKAFHIFRPFATDSVSGTCWCDLFIDLDNEIATITIPEEFYNNAVYPLVVDPTIGYTTDGSSAATWFVKDRVYAVTWYNENIWAHVDSLTARTRSSTLTRDYKPLIYLMDYDNSNQLLVNGIGPTVTRNTTWNTITTNFSPKPIIRPRNTYSFGFMFGVDSIRLGYDNGNLYSSTHDSSNSYTTPAAMGGTASDTLSGKKWTMYITYTEDVANGYESEKVLFSKYRSNTSPEMITSDFFEGNELSDKWSGNTVFTTVSGNKLHIHDEDNINVLRYIYQSKNTARYSTFWACSAKLHSYFPTTISGTDPAQLSLTAACDPTRSRVVIGIKIQEDTDDHYVVNIRYADTNYYYDVPDGWTKSDPMWVKVTSQSELLSFYTSADGENYEKLLGPIYAGWSNQTVFYGTGVSLWSGDEGAYGTVEDFIFTDYGEIYPGAQIYTTTSGMGGLYLPVTYSGSETGYVQLSTDLDNQAATKMRIRKDGATYAIMTSVSGTYD
jgi:hypothetical protein